MRSKKLSLVVGLIVLCIVFASIYAIADSCKSGCGTKSMGCGQKAASVQKAGCAQSGACGQKAACGQAGSCGATSACFSGGNVITRAYYGGTVKMRTGACPKGCSLMVAVLKQGDRPDANASVSASLRTAEGRKKVALQQVSPGVFRSEASLAGAKALELTVSGGGAVSSAISFDIPAAAAKSAASCGQADCKCAACKCGADCKGNATCKTAGAGKCGAMGAGCKGAGAAKPGAMGAGCGMNKTAGCPMSKAAAACKATAAGKCTGMAAGGCATAGACKAAGKTAACKCEVCKCAPCKCK
ncbi:MAG: hypothetical protein ACYC63_15905 [Armatimonadota bacterium]